ncbi:Oxidoreductase sirO [Pseudocercospora fuligena]|uniref:Oxidoreductase sirO n=1 Tax=Pseudocercospora fuligena TaxID=685502 RepID=A0A8H6RJT8_9PEZI|nr:Oxidoreductase sirO [Pseudocercospora fuligena]
MVIIFGDVKQLPPDELRQILQQCGITRIDTAARYQNGESEKIIGQSGLAKDFTIDTKVLFSAPKDAHLSPEAINKSLDNSLKVLGLEQVNVLYCHAPDFVTPISEIAKAFDEHYRAGTVQSIVPLAGGFLLSNFTKEGVQGGTRFSVQTPFTKWYDHDSMHDAISKLRAISEQSGLGMDELSLRWLKHHSILQDQDIIIMGAGKTKQITGSVEKMDRGPMDAQVVTSLESLWAGVEQDAAAIVDFELKP